MTDNKTPETRWEFAGFIIANGTIRYRWRRASKIDGTQP